MQRYSGIVQSVEQRTVNPYVTGSSPVARAKKFRRKIVDFAAFFFVNIFGFRHTTIHPKTPLFNPLATQQLHRIRNLSAVRWTTYHFTTHKKIYIFWTYCKIGAFTTTALNTIAKTASSWPSPRKNTPNGLKCRGGRISNISLKKLTKVYIICTK